MRLHTRIQAPQLIIPKALSRASTMDYSEAVRLVTAVSQNVIAAILQQFRNDQDAARAADRAQFHNALETARAADQAHIRDHFSNLHHRLDRLEIAERLRSSLPASGSTSFTSSSASFSPLGLGSPTRHDDQLGNPEGGNNDGEVFLSSEDDDPSFNHETFFNFGDNVPNAPRSPCSGIAAIALTEPLHGPQAAHPSCAPIHSSYELGVSTGGANLHEPLPVQPAMSTTWAPLPATCQPGDATHKDHQDIRDAERISTSGLRHNPRACALCAYVFTETKYRNMTQKTLFFSESSLQALQEAHVASFPRDRPVQVHGGISSS